VSMCLNRAMTGSAGRPDDVAGRWGQWQDAGQVFLQRRYVPWRV